MGAIDKIETLAVLGGIGVVGYLVWSNWKAITDVFSAPGKIANTAYGDIVGALTGTNPNAVTAPTVFNPQTGVSTGALSGVQQAIAPGGVVILPSGQTVTSNTGGTYRILGPVETALHQNDLPPVPIPPSNYTSPAQTGLIGNVTGTASTFNPSLPSAVAWAQPGSPAWNAYYNK